MTHIEDCEIDVYLCHYSSITIQSQHEGMYCERFLSNLRTFSMTQQK